MPAHLRRGRDGESAARHFLEDLGYRFLAANYRSRRGEIDLILRDRDCLVFVEVKTRAQRSRLRPASAVNARKRRHLSRVALEYLRELQEPRVRMRFDVVEVLMHGEGSAGVAEIRHLPNMFALSPPYRYG